MRLVLDGVDLRWGIWYTFAFAGVLLAGCSCEVGGMRPWLIARLLAMTEGRTYFM